MAKAAGSPRGTVQLLCNLYPGPDNLLYYHLGNAIAPLYNIRVLPHIYQDDFSREGVKWSHNNFTSPVDGNAANNAVIDNPLLKKTSGWRDIRPGSVSGIEWSLQEKSPVKNKGLYIQGFTGLIHSIDRSAQENRVKEVPDINPDIGAWSGPIGSILINAPRNLKISVKSK